jgi:hypothetical protein
LVASATYRVSVDGIPFYEAYDVDVNTLTVDKYLTPQKTYNVSVVSVLNNQLSTPITTTVTTAPDKAFIALNNSSEQSVLDIEGVVNKISISYDSGFSSFVKGWEGRTIEDNLSTYVLGDLELSPEVFIRTWYEDGNTKSEFSNVVSNLYITNTWNSEPVLFLSKSSNVESNSYFLSWGKKPQATSYILKIGNYWIETLGLSYEVKVAANTAGYIYAKNSSGELSKKLSFQLNTFTLPTLNNSLTAPTVNPSTTDIEFDRFTVTFAATIAALDVTGTYVEYSYRADFLTSQRLFTTDTTELTITGLKANSTVYARVQTVKLGTELTPYSSVVTTVTDALPAIPVAIPGAFTLNSPVSITGGFSVSWTASTDALGYKFYISESNSFTNLANVTKIDTGTTSTRITGIRTGITYYVKVQAFNQVGFIFSNVVTFS